LASKPVATVSSGLASKSTATVFVSLTSKLVVTVFFGLASKPVVGFLVEPQNQGGGGFPDLSLKTGSYEFSDLGFKIIAPVSWLSLKTKVVEGFLVWASKPAAMGLVIWASKSPRRFLDFGIKTKQTLVCWLRHKTDRVRSAWDTR
jgi:hypothetical protein